LKNTYKNISPEQKLKQALLLYENARELKKAAIKKYNPELTGDQIEKKVRELFNNAAK